MKGRPVVIDNSSKRLCHDLPEQIIHSLQHFFSASEIAVKVNPLLLAVGPLPFIKTVRIEFLHEKLRP